MRILIVFASAHGSTAEVARFTGGILREHGMDADIVSARDAGSPESYDACLLGSAIHNGLWLPDMSSFVRARRKELAAMPVYLWLNCMRVTEQNGYAYVTNHYLPNMLTSKVSFRKIGVFGGRLDIATIAPDEAWILSFRYDGTKAGAALGGDYRDWNGMRAWAQQVATDLLHPMGG